MISESLIESLKYDWKRTLYFYSPVMAILSIFYASTTLPIYQEQRGLVLLMLNYVLSYVTLNLMVHSMTGKPWSILQPVILLPMIPLVAHHLI